MVTTLDNLYDIHRDNEQRLESEIRVAFTVSKHLKAGLAQVARDFQLPGEVVEQIAQKLLQQDLGLDLEQMEFERCMKQVHRIETEVRDPAFREWKIQELARQVRRTPRQLREAYNKTLCQNFLPKPMNLSEFRATYQQEVEWLVQGWIPRGSTVLCHGDGGAGKTLFAYTIVEAVLHGTPWNGYQVQQGPVLLIQSDEPPLVTNERLDLRGIHSDDPLFVLPGWQADGIDRLEAYLEEIQPALVLVDSNTAINRNTIFSENDTEYARPILQFADLASRHKCTFIVIHHSNAAGESRGTRAIYNSVSEVWGLSASEGTDRLLRVQKTRLGRPQGRYKFSLDENDLSFSYLGEDKGNGEVEDNSTYERRILQWLMDADNKGIPFAAIELSERLAISGHTVRRCVYELWSKGLVKRKRLTGQRFHSYYVEGLAEIEEFTKLRTDQLINPKPENFSKSADQFDQLITSPETHDTQAAQKNGEVINSGAPEQMSSNPDIEVINSEAESETKSSVDFAASPDQLITSPPNSRQVRLEPGDKVEILAGRFTGMRVAVVGLKDDGRVEVRADRWLVTQSFPRQELRRLKKE